IVGIAEDADLLYDRHVVEIAGYVEHVEAGNNLLWNFASIHNVGTDSPFAAMPDYMDATQKAIEDRDPNMPEGLSFDVNF
ncbi:hypothetical protein AB9E21_35265, partial [Rhizobium leguminosarum]